MRRRKQLAIIWKGVMFDSSPKSNLIILNDHFKSRNGSEKIFYKIIKGNESCQNSFVLLHDLGDYHFYQNNLINFLLSYFKQDINIGLMDYKGHGLSSGPRGHAADLKEFVDDLFFFLDSIFSKMILPGQKYFIFAPGLSGLCLLRLLQTKEEYLLSKIQGIIFINPMIKPKIAPPFLIRRLTKKWVKNFGKLRCSLPNKFEIESDIAMVATLSSDPLVLSSISLSLMNAILKESELIRKSSFFYDGLTLFMLSGDDVISDSEITKVLHKGMRKKYSTLFFYKEMKHDILNSKNSSLALKDLENWFEKNGCHGYKTNH